MFCFIEPPFSLVWLFSLFLRCRLCPRCCISRGNHLIYAFIYFFLSFFLFNQTTSYKAIAWLNMQPTATSLIHRCIYLSCFQWEVRELCKSLNSDTWRQEPTLVPHLERQKGKSWNIKSEYEERKKWGGGGLASFDACQGGQCCRAGSGGGRKCLR